jgi:hypothetical protein
VNTDPLVIGAQHAVGAEQEEVIEYESLGACAQPEAASRAVGPPPPWRVGFMWRSSVEA